MIAQGSSTALEATVRAAKPQATTIRAVLRTTHAFIDRRQVRVTFQLRDAYGNVRVSTSGLSVQLSLPLFPMLPSPLSLSSLPLSSLSQRLNID